MTAAARQVPAAATTRVLSTLNVDGSRRWLRPRLSRGRFQQARLLTAWALIAFFVLAPYVKVGGHPLILLDVLGGKFHLAGMTFYATDTVLLMLGLLSVFIGIFLFTALFGRVWCGWACPQTVYLEFVYRPIERLIEGKHGGTGPRRFLKLPVFFLVSMVVAHTFLAYFVGVDQLLVWVRGSPAQHPVAFLVMAGVTLAMFFDFAYFREQTCIVACPYGRLQSVLLDRQSLLVGYDARRGEPRGKGRRRREQAASAGAAAAPGDCVDCGNCVTTCPTGIDIRDGLQMECVGCTQCIDACDAVMDKVGKPRGLIRYSSQAELEGRRRRLLRPRVLVYIVLLCAVAGTLVTQVLRTGGADVTLLRLHELPFERMGDGRIANRLKLKIVNRTGAEHTYRLLLPDLPQAEVLSASLPMTLAAGEQGTAALFVAAPAALYLGAGRFDLTAHVVDESGAVEKAKVVLLGPATEQGK